MTIWKQVIHPITRVFRRRRGRFLVDSFPDLRTARICDLGGSSHFWQKLALDIPRRNITIYNVSTDETQGTIAADDDIPVVIYDGKRIPVEDDHFDILICNSVLEHVPPDERAALAAEMRRVARSLFCQTPANSFPIEPHFLMPFVHWLPRRLGYRLIKVSPWRLLSRPTPETIRSYWWDTRLLSRREIERLFPDAAIRSERVLGLTKSYYVVLRGDGR